MNQKIKTAVFIFLIAILLAPMVQEETGLIKVKNLRGQGDVAVYPKFSIHGWFTDEFQVQFNKATEEQVGFRPFLIRLKNQFEYLAYNKANASGVVAGKDGYMFEADYIRSYTGRDYLGDYFWEQKFNRLAMVRDTLNKLGVKIAVVLEPGKATYHPEKIPGRFTRYFSEDSNYKTILAESEKKKIPLLDLNKYFKDSRSTAPYPLFPKGGIHWSTGGMVFGVDSLLGFIRGTLRLSVPDLVVDRVEMSDSLRDTDGDVVEIMNLLKAPKPLKMGYPEFHFESRDSLPKPKVLVISDSYFFNVLGAGIPEKAFANQAFWYYNKTIYPDSWSSPRDTSSLNVRETVEGMDLVLIMVTERFYTRFDWDLTDILYRHYFPAAAAEYRYDFIRSILRNYVWFDDIQEQADYACVPMEVKLLGNADYLFWLDDQAGKVPHDIGYYRIGILKDPVWMKQIREKAIANKISVDEQVSRDAVWMMEQKNQ